MRDKTGKEIRKWHVITNGTIEVLVYFVDRAFCFAEKDDCQFSLTREQLSNAWSIMNWNEHFDHLCDMFDEVIARHFEVKDEIAL